MVSGCACAASQNISLKRCEKDLEPVGRMTVSQEGAQCVLKTQLKLRGGEEHVKVRNWKLFTAFPSSALKRILEISETVEIQGAKWIDFSFLLSRRRVMRNI